MKQNIHIVYDNNNWKMKKEHSQKALLPFQKVSLHTITRLNSSHMPLPLRRPEKVMLLLPLEKIAAMFHILHSAPNKVISKKIPM